MQMRNCEKEARLDDDKNYAKIVMINISYDYMDDANFSPPSQSSQSQPKIEICPCCDKLCKIPKNKKVCNNCHAKQTNILFLIQQQKPKPKPKQI
ncbi:hypothetical protein RclHR1_01730015 [Rhizophagus clarus]|uniref:Uncharacterized protein n=1 Tax=Rhizophagus clarus TaxID=94130 RepID=A0A2Z6QJT4_9GLOM|nr:hypothetical protein RclHR1_01730015 [Rhizophagus clarus]GES90056.1 hypothetical protein RCL_jg23842.t1 [Rhizophagus clarus]